MEDKPQSHRPRDWSTTSSGKFQPLGKIFRRPLGCSRLLLCEIGGRKGTHKNRLVIALVSSRCSFHFNLIEFNFWPAVKLENVLSNTKMLTSHLESQTFATLLILKGPTF